MSIIRTIGGGMAWNTTATVLVKGIAFANIFIVLSHLSVYEYGLTELVFSVISILGIFLVPGLTPSVVADLGVERARGDHGRMKQLFLAHFKLNVALGVIAWAVLFFGSSLAASFAGNEFISDFLKIVSFLFLSSPLRSATTTLATVNLRFFDQSFYTVVEEGAKLAALLACLVWLGMGPAGLLYAAVIAEFAASLVFLPRTLSAYRLFSHATPEGRFPFWHLLYDHRKWGIGASYVNSLGSSLRLWILKLFLGTEAVGLFAFAHGLFGHMMSLMPLSVVLGPIVPRYVDKLTELLRLIRASIKLQLALSLLLVGGGFLAGPVFVRLLFPQYEEAIPLLLVILFAAIPNGVLSVFTPVFIAFKRQRSFFWATVFKVVAGSAFLPIGLLLFGILGAGLEVVATTLASMIERYVRLKKLIPEISLQPRDMLRLDPLESGMTRLLIEKLKSRASSLFTRGRKEP